MGGFLGLGLGLAALKSLLYRAGDPLFAEVGLTAYVLGAGLLAISETAWLMSAGLPAGLASALVRIFVILSFVGQAALGASIVQTGLLPAWLGWTSVAWNLGWLVLMLRAGDPYYPFMHLELPLLGGIWLLLNR